MAYQKNLEEYLEPHERYAFLKAWTYQRFLRYNLGALTHLSDDLYYLYPKSYTEQGDKKVAADLIMEELTRILSGFDKRPWDYMNQVIGLWVLKCLIKKSREYFEGLEFGYIWDS